MSHQRPDLDSLCRAAIGCRLCFERLPLQPALIDLAQPRWVGRAYWKAARRVAIVLLNPGSGEGYNDTSDRKLLELLRRYEKGAASLQEVFEHQAQDFANWGRGRFVRFYVDGMGLKLDEIALANIAWCATAGNQYPAPMLARCFDLHTRRLLEILSPDVILLSGSRAGSFRPAIQAALPRATVISTLHYAHRRSRHEEQQDILRVRSILSGNHDGHLQPIEEEEAHVPTISPRASDPRTRTGLDLTPEQTRKNIDALLRLGFSEFSLIHHMPGETLRSHSTYLGKSKTNAYPAHSPNLIVAQRLAWIRVQAENLSGPRDRECWTSLAKEATDRFPFE